MAVTTTLFILAAVVAVAAVAVYLVGIPAEWKEELQKQLMMRAGESQARDMLKDQMDKLPEADRNKAEAISSGIQKISGGKADLKNPLGGLMGGKEE